MTSEVITSSAFVDQIKESWKSYKDIDFPIAGDYYYDLIGHGIFDDKIIEIPLKHLPEEIYFELNKLDTETTKAIFYRTIKEIFLEKYGVRLTEVAVRTRRIKVMLV